MAVGLLTSVASGLLVTRHGGHGHCTSTSMATIIGTSDGFPPRTQRAHGHGHTPKNIWHGHSHSRNHGHSHEDLHHGHSHDHSYHSPTTENMNITLGTAIEAVASLQLQASSRTWTCGSLDL